MDPLLPDAEKVAALRQALPATGAGISLDTSTRGPLPAEAAAAMREAEEWELRVGRVGADREEDTAQRAAEARAVLAALVGADADDIALFPGLNPALTAAVRAPDWQAGDRAVTTSDENPEVYAALAGLRAQLGVEVDVVPLGEPIAADAFLVGLQRALSGRTRMVVVSQVTPGAGLRLPMSQVAELARQHDAWLVVDATQAAGAVPVAVTELGADFVAFATDTWPLGPEGTAGLWAGPRALRDARADLRGAAGYETLLGTVARPWPDARRFEAATLPRTTLLGLARAVGWLEMYVGLDWALERAARLAARLHDALSAAPGVVVLTPAASMGTIVSFRLAGWTAEEAVTELGRRVFAIVRAIPALDAVRASVAWFNTDEELARFADAVGEMARHTPLTLPRRPSLVVLPAAAEPDGE